jgi:hypothetical protein
MVDEASLAARDATRIEGRRALWRDLASQGGHAIAFVNLLEPDLDAIETAFANLE